MFKRLPIDPELANIMQGGMPDSSVHRTKHPTEVSWYRPHLDVSLQLIDEAARNRDARIIDVGGGESLGGSRAQFAAFLASEHAKWNKAVKESGAKVAGRLTGWHWIWTATTGDR